MCSANPLLVIAACARPVLIALLTLVSSANVFAATLSTPLGIGYPMLTRLLQEQIFNGPGHSASMYADELRCNTLELAEPAVSSDGNGRLRVLSNASFRIGTPLAGKCVFPLAWNGRLELMQQAYIENDGSTLAFRVVDSRLLSDDKDQASVPSAVWGWVSDRVHPRMESLKINLAPGMADTEALLRQGVPAIASFTPATDRLVSLGRVDVTDDQLVVQLDIVVPDASAVAPLPVAQPVLSEAELAQWDASWQAWDGFATWLILNLAQSTGPEVGDELADALLEARYDLRDALANDSRDDDVVRALFLKTWSRLAPLLRDVSADVPGVQALQLATFVSAGDALATIDQAAPYLGFRIDSDNLRQLARLMSPGVSPAQLEYSAEVDPALRRLLGLEPDFDAEEAQAGRPFDWLIPSAHAGQVDAALVQKLTHWVPAPPELDNYLSTVNALLEEVAAQEQAKPKVPAAYHSIYRNLLLATAWKETCWRQFVRNKGAVETIRSKGGAIGLMQINQHVWRGVYDIDRLNTDIGYNARAGNEILVHYLVDVALRKKEHERSGSAENLARATYAAYNGGPGQLTRYRNPSASKGARAVDAAFWKRYQAIGSDGYLAVRQCYSG